MADLELTVDVIRAGSVGGAGNDTSAIHDNVASEISAVASATVASADFVLIEDASDSNNKKRTTAGAVSALALAGGNAAALSYLELSSGLGAFGSVAVVLQPSPIADASGGSTVDAEARTAINALLAAMRSYGLIDT